MLDRKIIAAKACRSKKTVSAAIKKKNAYMVYDRLSSIYSEIITEAA